jgi:methyl-accepting chemotaxis protein
VKERANQLLPTEDLKKLAATGSVDLTAFKRLFGELSPGATLSAHRLLEEVMIKALSGRFEPNAVMLAPYREILAVRVSSLATIQRVALQSGIFFTFIGLTLAFQNGQFVAGTGEETISRMLDSLGLAFATSIAGLLASLTIIVISIPVRTAYFDVVRAFEEMIAAAYEVGRRLPQDVYFVNQLADVASAVGRSQESMQAVAMRTDRLTETISEGVDKVAALKTNFDQVIATIRADQQQLATEFKAYAAALDPNVLRAQVSTLSDAMNKEVAAGLEKVASMIEATSALHEKTRQRTDRIEHLIVQMARMHLDNREEVRSVRSEFASLDPGGERVDEPVDPERRRPPRRRPSRDLLSRLGLRGWRR